MRTRSTDQVRSTVLRKLAVADSRLRRDEAKSSERRELRDKLICVAVDSGVTMSEIAETIGCSQPRVSQIIKRAREEQG